MWSSPSVPSRLGCAFGAARPQVDVVVSKADHAGQAERTTQRSLRALATTAGVSVTLAGIAAKRRKCRDHGSASRSLVQRARPAVQAAAKAPYDDNSLPTSTEPVKEAEPRPTSQASIACVKWAQEIPVSRRATTAAAGLVAANLFGKPLTAAAPTKEAPAAGPVTKSVLDPREYRAVTLKNGLRVLLVSDKEAECCAAALNVHAGSFYDPAEIPGLSHLCERALLRDSTAPGDGGDFPAYVSSRGGIAGSFTNTQDSCFYFDCASEEFVGNLEKFSARIRAPKFSKEVIEQEILSIDAEHKNNMNEDVFRNAQLFNSRANKRHPYHRFATGNKLTLLDEPARQGISMQDTLVAHHAAYYVTSMMTLSVLSRDSLDSLYSLVQRVFSNLLVTEALIPFPGEGMTVFPDSTFTVAYETEPTPDEENVRSLQVIFPVSLCSSEADVIAAKAGELAEEKAAVTLADWRYYSPVYHVGAVVGYEGSGSVCAMLRKRGWATALRVGVFEENQSFATLLIAIDLTQDGLQKRNEVLDVLFGYLKFLRSLSTWPQQLLRDNFLLSEARWRCQEPGNPGETTVQAATRMSQFAKPEDYISGGVRLNKGPNLSFNINELVEALVPKNALILFSARELARGGNLKETEPWYGTKYTTTSTAELRPRWEQAALEPGLGLPPANQFIPENLELKAPRGRAASAPQVLRSDPRWEAFFLQDTEVGVPKAHIRLEFLTKLPRSTAKNAVLACVYQAMVEETLSEQFLYDARIAGLAFQFSSTSRGLQLFFSGYNDKLLPFTRTVVRAVTSFDSAEQPIICDNQRDELARQLRSVTKQDPWQQADYWATLSTIVKDYSVRELLSALEATSATDLEEFAVQLWRRESFHVVALCQGNLTEKEATEIIDTVDGVLRFTALPEAEWPDPTVVKLPAAPSGPGVISYTQAAGAVQDSGMQVMYQLGRGFKAEAEACEECTAQAAVFEAIFLNRIKAEFQSGPEPACVVAATCLDSCEGVSRLNFAFQISSESSGPLEINEKLERLLAAFRTELATDQGVAKLSNTPNSKAPSTGPLSVEIQRTVAKLAELRLRRPKKLAEAVEKKWVELVRNGRAWDRPARESAALKRVTPASMMAFMDKHVVVGAPKRQRLVAVVYGSKHKRELDSAERVWKEAGATQVSSSARQLATQLPEWV
mmetsp:Transcript_27656/g.60901  ORF Transcript_27656/g.60901 Transcript_27656/m.60901 type:complete len:1176 (+) Transcript_27656:8-3535(+)